MIRVDHLAGRDLTIGADHFRIASAVEADFFELPFDWRYALERLGALERTQTMQERQPNDLRIGRLTAERRSSSKVSWGKDLAPGSLAPQTATPTVEFAGYRLMVDVSFRREVRRVAAGSFSPPGRQPTLDSTDLLWCLVSGTAAAKREPVTKTTVLCSHESHIGPGIIAHTASSR